MKQEIQQSLSMCVYKHITLAKFLIHSQFQIKGCFLYGKDIS